MGGDLAVLVMALLVLAIVFFVFLALRAVVLWYWRVNEAMEKLSSIEKILANIDENLTTFINASAGNEPDPNPEIVSVHRRG